MATASPRIPFTALHFLPEPWEKPVPFNSINSFSNCLRSVPLTCLWWNKSIVLVQLLDRGTFLQIENGDLGCPQVESFITFVIYIQLH